MNVVASLPMYGLPEVHAALDTIWAGIARRLRRHGVDTAPAALVHNQPLHALWSDPGLFLSQCCGFDLVNRYRDTLTALATPSYTAPGCDSCYYASVVLVGESCKATQVEDLHDSRCVINGPESQSGMSALRALVAPFNQGGRFFATVTHSGTHANSIAAIRAGHADVCAIDCVTYALLERYRPTTLEGTRALCYTLRAPGIPYVTRSDMAPNLRTLVQRSLLEAFEDPEVKTAGEAVFIDGIQVLAPDTYDQIAEFELEAARLGYPELR